LHSISHEINTALNKIQGLGEILVQSKILDEFHQENSYLQEIFSQGIFMRNTVNDLNIYGQYVLGKMEMTTEPI
jgi:signal transduction histidine kinase